MQLPKVFHGMKESDFGLRNSFECFMPVQVKFGAVLTDFGVRNGIQEEIMARKVD